VTPRKLLAALRVSIPRVSPVDCAEQVRTGGAVLVDVRERNEWQRGYAESATLLPLSELSRSHVDYAALRQTFGDRELILYCGAGVRSHLAARILRAEGFRASNGGALSEWAASGWPIVEPDPK
jgi:rhodanese-related sulfurtransferase